MRIPVPVLLAALLALAGLACDGGEPTSAPPATSSSPGTGPGTGSPSPTPGAPTATAAETSSASPSGSPSPSDPSESDAGAESVTAWFVREQGDQRWVEPEEHALDEPTLGVARASLTVAVEGDPHDPGLVSLAPEGTRVLGADIEGDVLVVDLSSEIRNRAAGSGGEQAFAQQLAWTGAQFPNIAAVRLLVDGQRISDLWGEIDWDEPVRPDRFAQSPIDITSHRWGETIPPGPLTLAGTANTFEATIELRLVRPDGTVAEDTFTTATCGTGCRGDFSFTFETPLDAPGRWTVVAVEPDPSAGEGRPPFRTELVLEVR